ncbi:MAG TPA: hypothetical protein VHY91_22090 [Pirellulales bacterium]|jgi:hypothetical protein|nr:hypothetical protein [Pirellulales bacterium]
MPATEAASLVAKHGEKMIEVRVRFWTDSIAPEKGALIPKHAWDTGTVDMPKNESHGITAGDTRPFNSILELQAVIADVLAEHGVVLHANQRLRKIIQPLPGSPD